MLALTPRADGRISLRQNLCSRTPNSMRVAAAIALMILAMLAASSGQTTVARSEMLLPIEATSL